MVKVKKTIKKITTRSVENTTQNPQRLRVCAFCQNEQRPSFTDLVTLRRFLSERGKILPKGYTKACSKHQREVSKQIKYARHLSLFPFTPKV